MELERVRKEQVAPKRESTAAAAAAPFDPLAGAASASAPSGAAAPAAAAFVPAPAVSAGAAAADPFNSLPASSSSAALASPISAQGELPLLTCWLGCMLRSEFLRRRFYQHTQALSSPFSSLRCQLPAMAARWSSNPSR